MNKFLPPGAAFGASMSKTNAIAASVTAPPGLASSGSDTFG